MLTASAHQAQHKARDGTQVRRRLRTRRSGGLRLKLCGAIHYRRAHELYVPGLADSLRWPAERLSQIAENVLKDVSACVPFEP